MSEERQPEAFPTGTLAGAGSFHCEGCGFAIALQQLDEIPACPHCSERRFKRASIFVGGATSPAGLPPLRPDWLNETRGALKEPGDYLAFEQDGARRLVALESQWTRIGRSLAADIRFDDPTVSRRHALVVREDGHVRLLDDRSLNGVFRNGQRIEWVELEDGDDIVIGRFHLYFMRLSPAAEPAPEKPLATPSV